MDKGKGRSREEEIGKEIMKKRKRGGKEGRKEENTGRRADFMGTTDWVLCHV